MVQEGCGCRRASSKTNLERGIYVKHFKNIPMADMEIVLVSLSSCLSLDFVAITFTYVFFCSLRKEILDWLQWIGSNFWYLPSLVWLVSFFSYCASCMSLLVGYHRLSLQVAVVTSVEMPKADPWVIFAVLSTVVGYCAKTYFTLSVFYLSLPCLSLPFIHSCVLLVRLIAKLLFLLQFPAEHGDVPELDNAVNVW